MEARSLPHADKEPCSMWQHLRLLLAQKFLLKSRDPVGSLFELLIPLALILLLVSLAQISKVTVIPANNYNATPLYNTSAEEALAQMTRTAVISGFNVGGQPIPIFPPELRQCGMKVYGMRLGRLAFAPRILAEPLVRQIQETVWLRNWFQQCSNHPLMFDTEEEAVKWAWNDTNSEDLWALIVVTNADTATMQYTYKIRTRNNFVAQTPYMGLAVQSYTLGRGRAFQSYFTNGVLQIQYLLGLMVYCQARPTNCRIPSLRKVIEPQLSAISIPFPVEDVRQNLFFEAATGFVPLVFVIAFIYPLSRLVKGMVEEKEQRLKELLLMMSLHPTAYTLSWLVISQMQVIISTVFVSYAFTLLYTHTGFVLLFILILLYCTASVAVCFFISGWFNRARTAVLGAVLILFATEIPFLVLTENPTFLSQVLLSLMPNMAFSYAMRHVGQAEAANTGAMLDEGDFTIIHSMIMLAADVLIYHFLAWYSSVIYPGEFGLPQKPWFIFTHEFWRPGLSEAPKNAKDMVMDGSDDISDDPFVEPISTNQKHLRQVWVRNLKKVFDGNFVAVDGVNLSMCEDSIFVLLGHNGAGKTTTINMLTGMLPPSSGEGRVFGHSLRSDINAIRRDLGVCPQQNVLWPNYTVREHLMFFARLKGVTDTLEEEVNQMILAINLEDKADAHSSALSGGMKRRLCMGIALIGGSRLIFLDEPTAGMDPEAREQAHRLLLKNTKGRVMVLSTHFMDEADKLGDRIAILSHGKVRCCGSPLFLKSRLGVGYNLTVSLQDNGDSHALLNLIRSHVPSAVCQSMSPLEVSALLNLDTVSSFGPLFRDIESRKEELGVSAFGISMTKLEDVYLRIALETENKVEADPESPLLTNEDIRSHDAQDALMNGVQGREYDMDLEDNRPIRTPWKLLPLQFYAMVLKRLHVARRDRWFQFCLMVLPVGVVIGALLLTEIVAPNPELVLTPEQYPRLTKKPTEIVVADLQQKYDWRDQYPGVSYFNITNSTGKDSEAMTEWLLSTLKSHTIPRYGAFVVDGIAVDTNDGPVIMDTVMHNSTAFHALPTFYAQLLNLKLRRMLQMPALNLTFVGHTLPMTAKAEAAFNTLKLVGAAIIILFPFTFIPANFASFLVKERACKAKHVQVVSGVNLLVYWLSSYFWDIVQFSITVLFTMLTFWAFDKKEYIGTAENALATFTLFMLYGLASTALAYLCHFPFNNHTTSQTLLMLANLICGVVLVIVAQIMGQIDSTKKVNSYLVHWYRLLPAYCLGEGLLNLSFPPEFFTLVLHVDISGPFDLHVTGRSLIYLAIEAPVFFLLTLLCEYCPSRQQILDMLMAKRNSATGWELPEDEDEDVRNERVVEQDDGRPNDLVTVQRLCKEYPGRGNRPPHKAVKNLSFGVHEGEIFALLGVNGAGKTTTLSILSGEFEMTAGRALLNRYDIASNLQAARQGLGYCPQFDALLDLMTVEEHLYMYCRLRGIPSHLIRSCVVRTMRHVGLEPYTHRVARKLSGGNKRKLSMAIALIGGPKVVFLDEPSAGMDPVARRGMCKAIAGAAKGRSIILTTHHLEEVEALANRVGIMVAGEFRCLGNLPHLKAKFGQGYWLEFRLPDSQKQAVVDFAQKKFGKLRVEESSPGFLKLKAREPGLKLSSVFEEVEANRELLQLQDYAVSQPTLEQVFLNISELEEASRIRSDSCPRSSHPGSLNVDIAIED